MKKLGNIVGIIQLALKYAPVITVVVTALKSISDAIQNIDSNTQENA